MGWLTVVLIGLVLGLAGCGTSNAASSSAVASSKSNVRHQNLEKGARPELVVVPQQSSGFSVVVERVVLPDAPTAGTATESGGSIAIMREVHGLPAELLGYTKVPNGTASHMSIPVSSKLTSGQYFIGLYRGPGQPSVRAKPIASRSVAVNVA